MNKSFDISPLLKKMKLAADCGYLYSVTITCHTPKPPHFSKPGQVKFKFTKHPDKKMINEWVTQDNHFEVMNKAIKMIKDDASTMFYHLEDQRKEASAVLAKVELSKSAINKLITELH